MSVILKDRLTRTEQRWSLCGKWEGVGEKKAADLDEPTAQCRCARCSHSKLCEAHVIVTTKCYNDKAAYSVS